MNRARIVLGAMLVGASLAAGSVLAQGNQAPLTPILAGKKFISPIKGDAKVDFVAQPTRREGSTLVTKLQLKNMSAAPIARLKVAETWYDKEGGTIPGGEAIVDRLQPGEVATVEIRTPVNLKMAQSKMQFTHINGTVTPHRVTKLDGGTDVKEPAAKTTAAKTAKKKK